jgi:ribonucleoside-diphosphate reductase alpha chain
MTLEKYSGYGREITIDLSRDELLTTFGLATILDRYLWKNETSPQHMFARVACVNSDDNPHAQRMYDYMSKLWFMGSTPVLSNSGHDKNLPISCFLNSVGDNLEEINETYSENFWLASRGGGIGTYWGEVREMGAPVADRGKTAGVIPFLKIADSQTLGISQGSLRRGSAAAYLDVSHPEIEEFLNIRKPEGDEHRQCLNIHHGVVIPNEFMIAVKENLDWQLISPHTRKVHSVVKARAIWQGILQSRVETGEPYLWFVDNVNEQAPASYKLNGLTNVQSNLCSEITLSTIKDYNNKRRTAVCCLSSLNLEKWDEWATCLDQLVHDCMLFLDNVMQHFIEKTDGVAGFERANYSARQERSIGLGVMGFHGLLQSKGVPFEGAVAKAWNMKIFKALKGASDASNIKIALDKGSCPDAVRAGLVARFSHVWAIAPTASISIIAGESSPGIEPSVANAFKQKTLSGWFIVKNKHLAKVLQSYNPHKSSSGFHGLDWIDEQWDSILSNNGSVQHLDYLSDLEKQTFKTAFEMDQMWILSHAADRQYAICQGQSLNVFIPANVNKKDLNRLHMFAWEAGLKGLYYLRSKSIGNATKVSHAAGEMPQAKPVEEIDDTDYNEGYDCLSCQ